MNLSSPAAVSALLKRHDLRPRKRFGQNFLVDGNTLAKIVAAGELTPGGAAVEIGAGLGVLTSALAAAVGPEGRVVAVEVDTALLPALAETVGNLPQVTVVPSDALALDWPAFLDTHFASGIRPAVIANIPYNITTPLVTTFLEQRGRFSRIVLLVQKEVAARMAAKAGTDDYGALSVFVQYHAKVETIGIVSRRVFRAAFGQRRKALLNALSGDPALAWSREQAQAALDAAGIDGGRRGETLTLAEFAYLAASATTV